MKTTMKHTPWILTALFAVTFTLAGSSFAGGSDSADRPNRPSGGINIDYQSESEGQGPLASMAGKRAYIKTYLRDYYGTNSRHRGWGRVTSNGYLQTRACATGYASRNEKNCRGWRSSGATSVSAHPYAGYNSSFTATTRVEVRLGGLTLDGSWSSSTCGWGGKGGQSCSSNGDSRTAGPVSWKQWN